MGTPLIKPTQIKYGPGIFYWAALGTAVPVPTAAGSKVVVDWDDFTQVGATDSGGTYSESTDASPIKVAETPYQIFSVTTDKTGTVAFNMSHLSTTNWKLAANGGTVTTSGTGATKLDKYVPPLIGAEVRVMLGFHSLDETEAILWFQTFNTGGFETERGQLDSKHGLPVSFAVEMPDAAVSTVPYNRWTAGGLADSA
jgi:hypothetical protein